MDLGWLRWALLTFNGFLFGWLLWRMTSSWVPTSGAEEGDEGAVHVLVVVAHPDDEVLFFWPTLQALRRMGRVVTLLCMSDAPQERRTEMQRSAAALGVSRVLWGGKSFPDAMDVMWDAKLAQSTVENAIGNSRSVVTFDGYGVSGHANHVACFGACVAAWKTKNRSFHLLALQSAGVLPKYAGWIGMVLAICFTPGDVYVSAGSVAAPLHVWAHMSTHYPSQWVWFRKLMVLASRYCYVNTFTVFQAQQQQQQQQQQQDDRR